VARTDVRTTSAFAEASNPAPSLALLAAVRRPPFSPGGVRRRLQRRNAQLFILGPMGRAARSRPRAKGCSLLSRHFAGYGPKTAVELYKKRRPGS